MQGCITLQKVKMELTLYLQTVKLEKKSLASKSGRKITKQREIKIDILYFCYELS